jgi:hypothetical protein
LTASSNAGFAFGTGDFTVETWARPTTLSTGYDYAMVFDTRAVASPPNPGILVAFTNATGVWIFYESVANTITNTSSSAVANQWQHVALSRAGTAWKFFVDGAQVGTWTNGSNLGTSQPLLIGTARDNPGSDRNFPGYIDDLRITKVARYTSNFTPPTASFPDLSPTGRLTVAYTIDSDAAAYIAAVEAADGQALETATRTAIDSFVKGCKNDGIWNAIKASCILAGARTLAGALVPLVGTAPTSSLVTTMGDGAYWHT